MVGENLLEGWGTIGEEGPLNRSPKYPTVGDKNTQGRYYRSNQRYYRPPGELEAPTG